jgi:phosphinothricin acetyltransferase
MKEEHREAVVDIFNHFVTNTFAAYPEIPLGYDLFDRFMAMAHGYPSIVAKDAAGDVVGFAFLHPYHFARTLARAAEITYFVLPEHTRQGLGSRILERFIAEGRAMGVDTILAHTSSRNTASIRFHREHGFQECGRLRSVGRKFGKDFDVICMQLDLSNCAAAT